MVRAAPYLVGDHAAAHVHLGKVDRVLPDFVDQLGLRHQARDAAHEDSRRQAQSIGERAVEEFRQLSAQPGDLGTQVLGAGDAAITRAAQARHREAQQVNRLVPAAGVVEAPQQRRQVAQPGHLDGGHVADVQVIDLQFEVDRLASRAADLGDQRIGDQGAVGQAPLSHDVDDRVRRFAPHGVDRQAAVRVVGHQQALAVPEHAVVGDPEHPVTPPHEGHCLQVAAQGLAVLAGGAAESVRGPERPVQGG
jgi:hypothetical protein